MNSHAQSARLLEAYPGSFCIARGLSLLWQGRLRPTAVSREYLVTIKMDPRPGIPLCYVIEPGLHRLVAESRLPGRKLPHVYYLHGDPLCLFTASLGEWLPGDSIADTTVPWASIWLHYFEVWLATNTWEGSGDPYVPGKPRPALVFDDDLKRERLTVPLPDAVFPRGWFAGANGLAA
jgi:hypothetical protein